ncbi:phage tail sheath C-terminal domain-containing protein [Schinkia azotoformans]|uniref:phage tail sheath C-terminal domain-containing protein n=1 Tax=Schinkia azotoformans TaxID=1454 RepID=UPI002DBAD6D7|nr:phage tail sheath C-terminal domain-containing protein [Schinkia azotoformans]MEC1757379.1 phage tail sheath C-terminal domain-containing protein [Schinkia azotoformans]
MANIGLPNISIVFKGIGASAVQRGSRGIALLIVKEDVESSTEFAEYTSIDDLTTEESAKYTATNVQYIKDVLKGTPSKVIVAKMLSFGVLADILPKIKGKKFDWIGIAEGTTAEQTELASWIKSTNSSDNKTYKAVTYKATTTDDKQIVNFTNTDVTFKDSRGKVTGDKFVARLIGFLAGLPLTMSAIAKTFDDVESVTEPADLETAINNGEFVLFNDDGQTRVARGINSLKTTGEGVTDDMKYILVVEVMNLIYNDIYNTWKQFYKGKYKNNLDNQFLLIDSINSYFEALENDNLLDDEFDNKCFIDIEAQRLANIPKYGQDVVDSWDADKIMQMTFGTNVYLSGSVKILNAMEDFSMKINM